MADEPGPLAVDTQSKGQQAVTIVDDPDVVMEFTTLVQTMIAEDHVLLCFCAHELSPPPKARVFAKIAMTHAHAERVADVIKAGIQTARDAKQKK